MKAFTRDGSLKLSIYDLFFMDNFMKVLYKSN